MEIVFVRHATTQGNVERRFVGSMDVDIIPQGEELARTIAPSLPQVEHLYRSPMKRCAQSAALLWPGMEGTVVPQLRENDFGPFEGKNHEEVQDDPLYQQWIGIKSAAEFEHLEIGEGMAETATRVVEGLTLVVADMKTRGIQLAGVVTHGGTIMSLFSQVAYPQREYYQWLCKNCRGFRMKVVEGEGGLTLKLVSPVGVLP